MRATIFFHRILGLLIGVASIAVSGVALADPPTRVARLAYIAGTVSYSPAGENDWVDALLNRPLTTGDRLWADADSQDEMQIGSAVVRMNSYTSMAFLNLDDHIAQLQLSQGGLNVHVRRLGPNDVFEIDTPNLAFLLHQPGDYRVDVDADGSATTVTVRRGQAEADGEGVAYAVEAGQSYRFAGTGLQQYQALALPPADGFDRWALERDRRFDNSSSARYVSPDMIGYEDLDDSGSWRSDSTYGSVWVPSQVGAGWAPYQDGRWAWVDPWGWTWVDNAPWGFAVSHYGRWVNMNGGWGWVPGPVVAQPVYAPALVAFVGGSGFTLAISGGNAAGIAWFPLGPQDVYRPSYQVSLNYFANINTVSTSINHTNITNVYNNTNITNITYVNRNVPGAVVAVTAAAFTQSQPVAKSAIKLTKAQIGNTQVAMVAAVAPVAASVKGAAASRRIPPAAALARQVVVKTAPPAAPVSFAARQTAMAANPGKPLEPAALAKIHAAPAVQAPRIALVHPAAAAAPMSKAPPSTAAPKPAPVAGAVTPPSKQEHAAQEHAVLPAEAAPYPKAMTPPPAPEKVAKPAEIPAPHPQEVQQRKEETAAKAGTPPSNMKPTVSEPVPHPVVRPEPAPSEHSMPQREPAQMPKPAPVSPPNVVHAPAAPAPKPEAAKREEPAPEKGNAKKGEEEKQRNE